MAKRMKTHSGTAKRFKKTGSGGYKRRQQHGQHILTKKSSKRKRHNRGNAMVAKCDVPALDRLLRVG